MSVNAIKTQGTKVAVGDGASPEVFTDIPEIVSFSGPGGSGQVIDVTDLDSTAVEKIMGLADEGQLTLDVNYIPDNAVHAGLVADRKAQTLRNIRITFTDVGATVWTFAAYILNFTGSGGVNAATKSSITLEITGAITES